MVKQKKSRGYLNATFGGVKVNNTEVQTVGYQVLTKGNTGIKVFFFLLSWVLCVSVCMVSVGMW